MYYITTAVSMALGTEVSPYTVPTVWFVHVYLQRFTRCFGLLVRCVAKLTTLFAASERRSSLVRHVGGTASGSTNRLLVCDWEIGLKRHGLLPDLSDTSHAKSFLQSSPAGCCVASLSVSCSSSGLITSSRDEEDAEERKKPPHVLCKQPRILQVGAKLLKELPLKPHGR